MRGKIREERIALMSQAERDDLIPLARKVRVDARRNALQVVVEEALSLHPMKPSPARPMVKRASVVGSGTTNGVTVLNHFTQLRTFRTELGMTAFDPQRSFDRCSVRGCCPIECAAPEGVRPVSNPLVSELTSD